MPLYLQLYPNNSAGFSNFCCTSSNIKCSSAINFLDTLSSKLLDMANSLQQQFNECKQVTSTQEAGFILASIDAPKMTLGVKYEYIVYIQRNGPPPDGIFDETILAQLRVELGITSGL